MQILKSHYFQKVEFLTHSISHRNYAVNPLHYYKLPALDLHYIHHPPRLDEQVYIDATGLRQSAFNPKFVS